MARAQLSTGSYNKNDTIYAQQLLNDYGYKLDVDGIYGTKTQAAVRKFQKANGLAVDGILGKNTWAALTNGANSDQSYGYDEGKDKTYQALLELARDAQARLESPLEGYKKRLEAIADQITPFSYDVASDPLFRQYRDKYTREGSLAMLDTMGKAASLTGGYGSSYGQALGQQSYQSYLQKLGDAMPELYSAALERHTTAQDELTQRYDQLLSQAKLDLEEYQLQQKAVQELYDQAAQAYKLGLDKWYKANKVK